MHSLVQHFVLLFRWMRKHKKLRRKKKHNRRKIAMWLWKISPPPNDKVAVCIIIVDEVTRQCIWKLISTDEKVQRNSYKSVSDSVVSYSAGRRNTSSDWSSTRQPANSAEKTTQLLSVAGRANFTLDRRFFLYVHAAELDPQLEKNSMLFSLWRFFQLLRLHISTMHALAVGTFFLRASLHEQLSMKLFFFFYLNTTKIPREITDG